MCSVCLIVCYIYVACCIYVVCYIYVCTNVQRVGACGWYFVFIVLLTCSICRENMIECGSAGARECECVGARESRGERDGGREREREREERGRRARENQDNCVIR